LGADVKVNKVVLGTVLFLCLGLGTKIWAAETDQGQQFFMQYCASCHGKDGRGNGPVSPYLKITVPNLTLLKKNNKEIYPMAKVMSAIDGSRVVRAHGDREMPVWGEIFRKEAEAAKYTELTSLLKTKMIAEYVATLQR
jgi:mono/diheme cytochrome c family protein